MATRMNSVNLTPVSPFMMSDSDRTNTSARWKKWLDTFDMFIQASGITDEGQKKSLLLYCVGQDVRDIFDTLPELTIIEAETDYNKTIRKLNGYFLPKRNTVFEAHCFFETDMREGETMDMFVTRLRQAARYCDFDSYSVEKAIRDQAIRKCKNAKLQAKLLGMKEDELKLEKIQDTARAFEMVNSQSKKFQSTDESSIMSAMVLTEKLNSQNKEINEMKEHINKLSTTKYANKSKNANKPSNNRTYGNNWKADVCTSCGNAGGHLPDTPECPAFGRTCFGCKRANHFKNMCKNFKNVHMLTGSTSTIHLGEEDNDGYVFRIGNGIKPDVFLDIEGSKIGFLIDSGSSINIIDNNTYKTIESKSPGLQLTNSSATIYKYGNNDDVPIKGTFLSSLVRDNHRLIEKIYVTKDNHAGCLLSRNTAQKLGLLRLVTDDHSDIDDNNNVRVIECGNIDSFDFCEFADNVFKPVSEGIGKVKDIKLEINIDKNVQPVVQKLRPVPFHVRNRVKKKIEELIKLDIVEPVRNQPTPWLSPIVVEQNRFSEDIRLCIDMRMANQAILRSKYPMPTPADIALRVQGSKLFSQIDLSMAYHQIELSENSRYITAFTTHCGTFRFKRLIFGAVNASDDFQRILTDILSGCPKTENISDNILVHGSSKEEHDKNLLKCLRTLKENGLTANISKCKFGVTEIDFFGYVYNEYGIRPTDEKIEAIRAFEVPNNPKELSSFLGLANWVLAKFTPHYSTLTAPLRQLIVKGAQWHWGPNESRVFDEIKQLLSNNLSLAHFDSNLRTRLYVDASPVGLGSVLAQEHSDGTIRPVAFASRALTEVECRYSQTEREALAVVWGCEKFNFYLFGSEFDLMTDHKPLLFMFAPKGNPPARVLRWALRLQPYRFKAQYIKGGDNISDVLSRQPLANLSKKRIDDVEHYINFVIANAVPRAVQFQAILEESKVDSELSRVVKCLEKNEWHNNPDLKCFFRIRNELSHKNGIVLKGNKLVIPYILRQQVLAVAHESHLGKTKTKQLLRSKVWWPSIDGDVDTIIDNCSSCQITGGNKVTVEPLHVTKMPTLQWDKVHLDILGPFPDNRYIVGLVDEMSRWPEIFILHSTNAHKIGEALDRIFSRWGFPGTLITDNGPQFLSSIFEQYCVCRGIYHRRVTPYWPRANGQIERFFKTILKIVKIANLERKNYENELSTFLLAYRNTPHSLTGVSPAQLMLKFRPKLKLPSIDKPKSIDKAIIDSKKNDYNNKIKMKKQYDTKYHVGKNYVKPGDHVWLKQRKFNKFSTLYDPRPYLVLARKGTALILKRNETIYKRNVSIAKKCVNKNDNLLYFDDNLSDSGSSEILDDFSNVSESMSVDREQGSSNIGNGESVLESETARESDSNSQHQSDHQSLVRRSNRISRPPDYLKDVIPSSLIP